MLLGRHARTHSHTSSHNKLTSKQANVNFEFASKLPEPSLLIWVNRGRYLLSRMRLDRMLVSLRSAGSVRTDFRY